MTSLMMTALLECLDLKEESVQALCHYITTHYHHLNNCITIY